MLSPELFADIMKYKKHWIGEVYCLIFPGGNKIEKNSGNRCSGWRNRKADNK